MKKYRLVPVIALLVVGLTITACGNGNVNVMAAKHLAEQNGWTVLHTSESGGGRVDLIRSHIKKLKDGGEAITIEDCVVRPNTTGVTCDVLFTREVVPSCTS